MKRKLLLLLFIPLFLCSQGTLNNAKKSLSKKNSKNSSITSNSRARVSQRSNSSYFFNRLLSSFVIGTLYQGSLGLLIGRPDFTRMHPYPYYTGNEGEYHYDEKNTYKNSNLKLEANYLINRVKGLEFNAVYKPFYLAGIEVSHLNFSEKTLLNSESLNITSVNLNYYRIRKRNFSMWWGAGASYVGNEVDTWGFTYNVGTNIYPFQPISFHLGWKQSFINDNSINVFKSQVKYHIKKTALYTGYHNYALGSETVSGLVLGVEYTF